MSTLVYAASRPVAHYAWEPTRAGGLERRVQRQQLRPLGGIGGGQLLVVGPVAIEVVAQQLIEHSQGTLEQAQVLGQVVYHDLWVALTSCIGVGKSGWRVRR